MEPTSFFFDMDSTLLSVEAGDLIAERALRDRNDARDGERIMREWVAITDAAMNGEIGLEEAIRRRCDLVNITRTHVKDASAVLPSLLTNGMADLIGELQSDHGCECWIVTASIGELALPVAKALGIPMQRVRTNTAVWTGEHMTGFAPHTLLGNGGKAIVVKALRAEGKTLPRVVAVGDGIGDLGIFTAGAADDFFGYGEHAVRPEVQKRAPNFFQSVAEMRAHLGL